MSSSILFLGKKNDKYVNQALKFCRDNFSDIFCYLGEWGDPFPEDIGYIDYNYIISYLSRWILPDHLLKKAKIAAINFHPAPPEYPGFGGNNFALYEQAKEFGVTCHHMAPKVDSGKIIAVKRFPIFTGDNISSLLDRTYIYQLGLFYDIMGGIINSGNIPSSNEHWNKQPYTRKMLDEISHIKADMSQEEISKRVRATSFNSWKPTVIIGDYVFELRNNK